jgi:hypothetical protein
MSILGRFTDYSASLRCSKAEAVGSVTRKEFLKDAGFGDCPMQIDYEFADSSGQVVVGKHVGTESSFYGIKVGDRILIRYLQSDVKKNAPKDALGIITSVLDNG